MEKKYSSISELRTVFEALQGFYETPYAHRYFGNVPLQDPVVKHFNSVYTYTHYSLGPLLY